MSWKRKLGGGALVGLGFLLSPLSWWSDLVVNLPLAVAAGWLVSLVWPAAFEATVIVAYWLTNVLGFVLLHKGAQQFLAEQQAYSRRELLKDAAIALLYTLLIALLVWLGVLKPVREYFG